MNLNENILRIKEVMGLLNEERKGKKVKIYLNGGGSDNAEEYRGSVSSILVSDTIPNEPFKDEKYLKKSKNVKNMIKMIDDGEKLPPIKVIKHPNNSSKYVVIDGNHRRYAFSKSSKKEIDAIIIPHEDVLLMKNKWGEKPESYINLPDVIKDKKIVNKYFVKPNGDNDFETDKKEIDESEITEKCWSGYKKKGMKTMYGKKYPNCVKK